MYCFCTYFDRNYLPRGLALYRSLREHCPEFKLWVLCMDVETHEALTVLALPEVEPIALQDFEGGDAALLAAKGNRTRIEYYFTCTPALPLYVLNHWPAVDLITYLDADLYFFSSPAPLFEELGTGSIAIIGHRFPPQLRHMEKQGIYNVGWLSFRRDEQGLACLAWWREQCIAWCHDREEAGRFADQKYLDDWPSRFRSVIVLNHPGANLAPWNLNNYHLRSLNTALVLVDDAPLIFFHFHGFRKIARWLYDPGWAWYGVVPSRVLRSEVYDPYLRTLLELQRQLPPASGSRRALHRNGFAVERQGVPAPRIQRLATLLGGLPAAWKKVLKRHYIIAGRCRWTVIIHLP
jgi:hypothetical protein